MAAFVRVTGPPNSNFLVGYPGISATLVSPQERKTDQKRKRICFMIIPPQQQIY